MRIAFRRLVQVLLADALLAVICLAQSDILGVLPDDFEVHTIGISRGAEGTDVVIDDSRRFATLAKVVVNKPATAVVLVLSGISPVIWQVGRTEGTEIAGVILTGTGAQALIGIEEDVPYAISTRFRQGDFVDFLIDNDRERLLQAQETIKYLTGRGTTLLRLNPKDEILYVGDPADPEEVIYSDFLDIDDYLDPSNPPGRISSDVYIQELLDAGKVRPATEVDVQAWFDAASEPFTKFNNPELRVDLDVEPFLEVGWFPSYFILERFEFSPNEHEFLRAAFLVPEDLALPDTFATTALSLHRMDGQKLGLPGPSVNGMEVIIDDDGNLIPLEGPPDDRALKPVFDGLPDEYKLYAVDAFESRFPRPELQFDEENPQLVTQVDVIVNEPDGTPVVLVLTSGDSLLWNVGYSDGTNIAGVIMSGVAGSAVVGVPENVPYLNSTFQVPGDFEYMDPEDASIALLWMNYRLKQVSGKDIDHFYFEPEKTCMRPRALHECTSDPWEPSSGIFHIGQPLQDAQVIHHSSDLNVDEFVLPDVPLYGRAGLEKLAWEGKVRPATQADINAAISRESEGLPEFAPGEGLQNPWLSPGSTWVILDAIKLPNGLAGSGILSFILPDSVPEPEGDPAHTETFRASIQVTAPEIVVDFELWAEQLEENLGGDVRVTVDSDSDRDGVKDVIEYVTGSDALDATSMYHLEVSVERRDGAAFANLAVPLRAIGPDAEVTIEQSRDGLSWEDAQESLEFVGRQPIDDHSALVHLRSDVALSEDGADVMLFRLRAAVIVD